MDKPDTYYTRNKQARRAYQRAYYEANRKAILRQAQLRSELEPEKAEKIRVYQKSYYLKNREAILARKREKYLEDRYPVAGVKQQDPVSAVS